MKLFWASQVLFLLGVVKLEATPPACGCLGPKRNLTVTVDDILRLYLDGVEITDLPNAKIWNQPDVVDFPCSTRLIAIHGTNLDRTAGILASTDDDYVLTNFTWKCSNVIHSGWEEIDFDDSAWVSELDSSLNGIYGSVWFRPRISSKAAWIWLRPPDGQPQDRDVYCRKRLDINEGLVGCSDYGCKPSVDKCIDLLGNYNSSCNDGYTNNGSRNGFTVSNSCNDSTFFIIVSVFIGISVLGNVALRVWPSGLLPSILVRPDGSLAICVLQLRKTTVKDKGRSDVDVVLGDDRSNDGSSIAVGVGFENMNSHQFNNRESGDYESLQHHRVE